VQEHLQHGDDLTAALWRCTRQGWRNQRDQWLQLQQRLARLKPVSLLRQHQENLGRWERRLREGVRLQLGKRRQTLDLLRARLALLGPENVLARGYSITQDEATGRVLRRASEVRPGQRLRSRLATGTVHSVVEPEPEG
jgi:exodeoxyribonuclease VII large subunit